MSVLHFRASGRIPDGLYRGRTACGFMASSHRATMNWKRVTCARCRQTIGYETVVMEYVEALVDQGRLPRLAGGEYLSPTVAISLLKRHGWPLAVIRLPT